MAKGAINVSITGKYDDKDINKAIRDLDRLKTDAGAAKGPMMSLGTAIKGMAVAGGALALGSVVSGLTDFAKASIGAALEARKADDRLNAIASSMGLLDGVLGGSTKRLQEYADKLEHTTGVTAETVKAGQSILLTFGEVAGTAGEAGGMFDRATAALLDLSAAGFGDAATNAKSLGRALQDPIKGLTALGRQGVTFTEQEKEKIKALMASNRVLEAQNIIMAAVEKQVGGTAEAVATDFDKIANAFGEFQDAVGFALLDSIEDTTEALGGTDALIPMIRAAGEVTGDLVRGVGVLVTGLTELAAASGGAATDGDDLGNTLTGMAEKALMLAGFVPGLGQLAAISVAAGGTLVNLGQDADAAAEQVDALTNAAHGGRPWVGALATETAGLAVAAAEAAVDVDELKDATKEFLGAISLSQSMDDFRVKVSELADTLDGNKRSFRGLSEAAKENRDVLRDSLGDAAKIVQSMVEEGKISADEAVTTFATMRQSIIDGFITQGFKPEQIRAFLGAQDLWTSPFVSTINTAGSAAAEAGYGSGRDAGRNFGRGVAAGIESMSSAVQAEASRLTALANSYRPSAAPNIPGRAAGGPVMGGSPYIVGERGPELFVPSSSGSITPNHRMGGGASVNVTVNAGMGADGYQIGQQVVDAIKKYERVAGPVFAAA